MEVDSIPLSVCSIVSESSNRRDVCICLGCKPNFPCPLAHLLSLHRGGITISPAHAPRMENISLYASSFPLELHVDLFNSKGNSSILSLCSFSKELQEHRRWVGRRKAWGSRSCVEKGREALSFAPAFSPSLHLQRTGPKINGVRYHIEFHNLSTVLIPDITGKMDRNRVETTEMYV